MSYDKGAASSARDAAANKAFAATHAQAGRIEGLHAAHLALGTPCPNCPGQNNDGAGNRFEDQHPDLSATPRQFHGQRRREFRASMVRREAAIVAQARREVESMQRRQATAFALTTTPSGHGATHARTPNATRTGAQAAERDRLRKRNVAALSRAQQLRPWGLAAAVGIAENELIQARDVLLRAELTGWKDLEPYRERVAVASAVLDVLNGRELPR